MSERDDRPSGADATALGVDVTLDVTLIDEMLRLSPAERLRQNDRVAALAMKLRDAFAVGDGKEGGKGGKEWKTPGS